MIKKILRSVKTYAVQKKEKSLLKRLTDEDRALIIELREKNLTYLSSAKMANIVYTIRSMNEAGLKGKLIEAGCALGGSSILISKLKLQASEFKVYDVFGMIPPPTKEDPNDVGERYQTILEGNSTGLGPDLYYGYEENLFDKVIGNLKSFDVIPDKENITLIKGLVQDTMHLHEPVVFAHIDVDWYEPVTTCLSRIWPNLVMGGCIILDDYHDWGGCRKATDGFLRKHADQYSMDDRFGSLKITKIK